MTSDPAGRRARREAQRAEARRAARRTTPASRWLLPGLIAGAVVVAAVLAIALSGGGQPTGGDSSSVPPSAAGGSAASASAAGIPAPVISGTPLAAFPGPGAADPAVGQPAPEVTGADFGGAPVAIDADGRPKVLIFLAHWCPHCQEEVPVVQAWVTAGGVPDGVDLIAIATANDPAGPNYPPDAWLEREGWSSPVLVDPANTVSEAYGLTAFPFWVFIGPDGAVRARVTGELSVADLEAAIRGLTPSGDVR